MSTFHSHIVTRGSMKLAHNNDRRDDFRLKTDDEPADTPVALPQDQQRKISMSIEQLRAALHARDNSQEEY